MHSSAGGNKKKKKNQRCYYDYKIADTPPPSSFVFHYAPKDWLQDKGIIWQSTWDKDVNTPHSHTPSPTPRMEPRREPTTPAANNATLSNSSQPK
ncbi:hypothetical protein FRC10_005801, partial [Ceratobasidium sp. 414]